MYTVRSGIFVGTTGLGVATFHYFFSMFEEIGTVILKRKRIVIESCGLDHNNGESSPDSPAVYWAESPVWEPEPPEP